jgi:LmbE family N-acetylglucosaminyl deacetylase
MMATAGNILLAAAALPFSTLEQRLGGGGLVVIAPHPDDESLACGGLIAEACETRIPTRVLVLSDGTGSHPRSIAYPHQRLLKLREDETKEAVKRLGLDAGRLVFLRLRDRFVPSTGPAAEAAIEEIVQCVRSVEAKTLFVSWRHDPHCDHQAAYQMARAAQSQILGLRLYEYTVWGWSLPPSTLVEALTDGFRIGIGRQRAKKQCAISAHRSQTTEMISDDPSGFRLTAADLAHFDLEYEFYFESAE